MTTPGTIVAVFGVSVACIACGGADRPPHLEDAARATVPVPACVVPLQPRASASGLRILTEDEIWRVLFPRYDSAKHELPGDAEACTGARLFDDPLLAGAPGHNQPIAVKEGDILFGGAGDRVRVVWLRTHRWPDGSEGGPLALVRASEASAEVYAVGVHRRLVGKSTFQAERVGTEMLVTAVDDGCDDQPKTSPCASTTTLYLPHLGRLDRLKAFTTEQRAFGTGTEPGVMGQLENRLVSSPEYGSSGVKVFEEIETKDSGGRVLHKLELERSFVLKNGALEGGPDSLWGRVQAPAAQTAPPSSPPPGARPRPRPEPASRR